MCDQEEEPQSEILAGEPDDKDLGQSEGRTHQQQPIRKAVWLDEDDELEEE